MKGLIGKKVGMTQIFDQAGRLVPVTLIEAGPCFVVQVRTPEKDGYAAVQLGFGEAKSSHLTGGERGHLQKATPQPLRYLREFEPGVEESLKPGDRLTVEVFAVGERVDILGTSKGKGFQGVVKRWHFHGQPATHGASGHRVPGSIGSSAYPSRVLKGVRMGGHMGAVRSMARGQELVRVDPQRNLLFIKGVVPGFIGGFVIVQKCHDWMTARKKAKFKSQTSS